MKTELKTYRGNRTHGTEGSHLGYRDPDKGLVILCGLSTENKRQCRCSPWWGPMEDTTVTCRECYQKGKAMHDASE